MFNSSSGRRAHERICSERDAEQDAERDAEQDSTIPYPCEKQTKDKDALIKNEHSDVTLSLSQKLMNLVLILLQLLDTKYLQSNTKKL